MQYAAIRLLESLQLMQRVAQCRIKVGPIDTAASGPFPN